jgi:hypothetical protein
MKIAGCMNFGCVLRFFLHIWLRDSPSLLSYLESAFHLRSLFACPCKEDSAEIGHILGSGVKKLMCDARNAITRTPSRRFWRRISTLFAVRNLQSSYPEGSSRSFIRNALDAGDVGSYQLGCASSHGSPRFEGTGPADSRYSPREFDTPLHIEHDIRPFSSYRSTNRAERKQRTSLPSGFYLSA